MTALKSFLRTFYRILEKLLENDIDSAATNQAHLHAFEQMGVFRRHKNTIRSEFYKHVIDGFDLFKADKLSTHIRENELHNESWSLVDENVLEETICITTHSTELQIEYREKLWQLEQRFEHIKNIEVGEANNPLSPIQFFVALRSTLKTIPLNINTKTLYYKALRNITNQQYATLLNKANAFLISEGILPEIRYEKTLDRNQADGSDTVTSPDHVKHSENGVEGNPQEETQDAESEPSLVNSIRSLLQRARHVSNEEAPIPVKEHCHETVNIDNPGIPANTPGVESAIPVPKDPVVFNDIQIVEAVEAVQDSAATAHFFAASQTEEIVTVATNISENSARVYRELYNASPDGSISAKNMYTIDMVGMLFEYILSDENLPDSVKTLLSHLHTPFLKLAFLDSTFFENEEHESRMLLNSLAEAGANWVHHDGTSQYDMYNEIKRTVQRAVKEFKNDVNLFGQLLIEFNMLTKRVTHMHNLRERNSIEKKEGQEKHEQAKTLAREEIKKRIEGKRVPSSIISLLSPWFTYLTHIQLREGIDSDKWKQALAVIDNLTIYSSIKTVKQDVSKLEEGFETIITVVKVGLSDVAYNQAKSIAIIDELNELKDDVLKKRTIKTTVATEKKNPTQGVPPVNNTPSPEEERVMNYIKLIEPGTWIEYYKQHRLKVNGYKSETGKYILIDQSSQEVTMLSRLEFARDILAEKATIIDGTAKPLFERALENIRQNLGKQVQLSSMMS